jgi:G3E family GTPase
VTQAPQRLPVTVVGGYLGAGKTTLINHLLADPSSPRLAILVNDFGDINIDAALIEAHGGDTISLRNGCLCCSIGDDLGRALDTVLAGPNFVERIVVEASGVAEPARVAAHAGGWPGCAPGATIVVADAAQAQTKVRDKYVGRLIRNQLAGADVLLMNKCDLLTHEEMAHRTRWFAGHCPDAVLVPTVDARIAASELFATDRRPNHTDVIESRDAGYGSRQFATISLPLPEPCDRARLEDVLARLPASIVRAKGFLRLADDPNRTYLLQLAGGSWRLDATTATAPALAVVFIGTSRRFDPGAVRDLFKAV